jgi:serine protease Do
VSDVKQFSALMAKLDKSKAVTLLVRRGDWVNYIVIRPSR